VSVYFITCRKTGMVKIGCAYDPFARLKTLQSGSPTKLKIEALLKGSHKRERELHKLLAKHRVRGEWFRICDAIEAIIKEVARPTRVKLLAEKRRGAIDLHEMDQEPDAKQQPPVYRPPQPIGFPDPLPPPRVSAAFDERLVSRATRKRIAEGDIIFPFRAKEDA
jgi:predicted GIY-YIG superfamily endonuclease